MNKFVEEFWSSFKSVLAMAEKWNGGLPTNILPANSPLLMNLGNSSSTNK